jgi:molybdate transport system substrate-binding protein
MKNTLCLLICLGLSLSAFSQKIRVAIAANIQAVMKEIQEDFRKKTGIEIETITGASGNLATQIRNGAPFDVFLSADVSNPEALEKEGFVFHSPSEKSPVKTYARGSLIVCSRFIKDLVDWKTLILSDSVQKIALANPQIAPYGKAAMESLTQAHLLEKIRGKIVQGESITQVNTYINTGLSSLGFTSKSFVLDPNQKEKVYWALVDPKSYAPIQQGMVILKSSHGENLKSAMIFQDYIFSRRARNIFTRYGYTF